MPLTLVTGTPGAGKSLYVVDLLSKETERPIYYANIDNLNLPWIKLDDPFNWHLEVQDNAIVVIDEVQTVFPQRGTKREAPDAVRFLEIHRHHGLDVYFITQLPKLLDHHARALVGHHIHFTRKLGWSYSTKRQSDEIMEISLKESSSVAAEKFVFPKKAYQYYKSAEVHTIKKRIPAKLFLLPTLLLLLGGIIYGISNTIFDQEDLLVDTEQNPFSPAQAFNSINPLASRDNHVLDVQTDFIERHTPAIEHLPQTAPIYNDLYDPVVIPRTAACIYFHKKNRCTCWTQQATKVPTKFETCKEIALNGYFDHTIENTNRIIGEQRQERTGQGARSLLRAPAQVL